MASPGTGDPRRSGYWQGSAANPYLGVPGDAAGDEEPLTRRRPEPIPSPAPRPAAQRRAHPRETRPSATRADGDRAQPTRQAAAQPARHEGAQGRQASAPAPSVQRTRVVQGQSGSSADRTRVVQGRSAPSAQGTRVVQGQRPGQGSASASGRTGTSRPAARSQGRPQDAAQSPTRRAAQACPQARTQGTAQARSTARPEARRAEPAIATPLPPRPTIRGASMAGTDRLARAEAARRALDSDAYFLDESLQPRYGRGNPQAQRVPSIPTYRLHFWRWFRTLPIVVMALFGAASIVVSLGLFGIDKLLYPVEYNEAIAQMAETYGVDPMLVSAIIRTESGWNPSVVSRVGAVGLMQLLPDTASDLAAMGVVDSTRYDPTNLLDPETNIAYGTAYLRQCLDGTADVDQAIAAYNAGIGAAQDWAQSGTPFEEAIQYPETTAYLERVRQNLDRYLQTYTDGFPTES